MRIRAGIVRATLQSINMLICSWFRPIVRTRVLLNGAILNQAIKERKKAIHDKRRIWFCWVSKLNINFKRFELVYGDGSLDMN